MAPSPAAASFVVSQGVSVAKLTSEGIRCLCDHWSDRLGQHAAEGDEYKVIAFDPHIADEGTSK